jgi:hypothetical protein
VWEVGSAFVQIQLRVRFFLSQVPEELRGRTRRGRDEEVLKGVQNIVKR